MKQGSSRIKAIFTFYSISILSHLKTKEIRTSGNVEEHSRVYDIHLNRKRSFRKDKSNEGLNKFKSEAMCLTNILKLG